MRLLPQLLLAAVALAPHYANAELITYEFSGAVDTVWNIENDVIHDDGLDAIPVKLGYRMTGRLTYDDAVLGEFVRYGSAKQYRNAVVAFNLNIKQADVKFVQATQGNIIVQPNGPWSDFDAISNDFGQREPHSGDAEAAFFLFDFSDSRFQSKELTQEFDFASRLNSMSASISVYSDPHNYYFASAKLDHIARVTPVPEPATYAMLLSGLGLLGAASLRARNRG